MKNLFDNVFTTKTTNSVHQCTGGEVGKEGEGKEAETVGDKDEGGCDL